MSGEERQKSVLELAAETHGQQRADEKAMQRQKLQADMQKYLASGGVIYAATPGETGDFHGKMQAENRKYQINAAKKRTQISSRKLGAK